MNKYLEKLERVKAKRISWQQRFFAALSFFCFVCLPVLIFINGLSIMIQINKYFASYDSVIIYYILYFINIISLPVFIYISYKSLKWAFKNLVMALSGISENSDAFDCHFEENHLPDDWVLLDSSESALFCKELSRETSRKHILYKKKARALARRNGEDQVLFWVKNAPFPYYLVYLTWQKEKQPYWPRYQSFECKVDFKNHR